MTPLTEVFTPSLVARRSSTPKRAKLVKSSSVTLRPNWRARVFASSAAVWNTTVERQLFRVAS
ncbi:hypothetical protein [Streptomyces cyaneofuscatus]|uniref:hypothetical protein n=1 Tax=Streptomyces cyaneofuscatus TaxID=66883 RepID=UPI0036BF986C